MPTNSKIAPCLWTQAGVIDSKECAIDFECSGCDFDREMGNKARDSKDSVRSWKDSLKDLPAWKRPCIHHMKKRIAFRSCNNAYRCMDCEFDQYFQDQFTVHAVVRPVDVLDAQGFRVPQGYYFHQGHTWVKLEQGGEVRVGLDDFLLKIFAPLDTVESPLLGKEVKQGDEAVFITRDGHTAKVMVPVSGIITAINLKLRENGCSSGDAPYSDAWIMRISATNLRNEIRGLMIGDQALDYIEDETQKLFNIIEEHQGPLAADGGFPEGDLFGKLPGISWDRLTNEFVGKRV